jgi:hypothetical protein
MAEAFLISNDPLFGKEQERKRILDFAVAHRLPTIFENILPREIPRLGVLLSYGPDLMENPRLAASYVYKILKGAKPAYLRSSSRPNSGSSST